MEVVEGEERGDHGIIFKKVGPELRVVEEGFTTIPSQALAISNKFGLTFFLHSQGFCIARTRDLVQASQSLVDSKNVYNAKNNAIASIHLPSAQALALSQDELIIAVGTEDKIQFYNVPALVHKGKEESQNDAALLKSLQLLDEKPGAKTFAWNPAQNSAILVVSKGGKLTIGLFVEQHLADEVEAADWSPDGEYLCYITSDKNVHICKPDLSLRSSFKLPLGMFSQAINGGFETHVDVLKWARFDSILISCVHIDSDGEEANAQIFVLALSEGHIAKDHSKAKILSFEGFFTSIDTCVLPPDTGPYTLANYVQLWELLIVTNRRSVDDHISLLGWVQEGAKSEAYKFELLDDRFTPRIELQECGDDNCVVGLAVDKTTESIEIPAPNGDSGEKLKPGPVLLCMTLEGNLSLFSMARTDNQGPDVGIINCIMELPESNEVLLSHGLACKRPGEKAAGMEHAQNQSMYSGKMAEKTNNEELKRTPTTSLEAASGLKLGPLETKKDLSKGGVEAGMGVPSRQKETPVPKEFKMKPVFPMEKKVTSAPVLSEMESDFLRELDEVKDMAMQIESLMAFIEEKGKEKRGEWKPSFTKSLVEDIECKTRNLYRQSQNFRDQLMEQRRSIIDLRDESLQVDAWRVYVQSILEQDSDVRYQEFRSQQTLHPEVAAMRKRILQSDQALKQQIAELEEHLHNLELSQWQKKHHSKQTIISSSLSEDKNFRLMQSLYDTVNTQMVIAQQLAGCLTKQMEALKLPAIPKEDMDMVLQEQYASDLSCRTGSRQYSYGPSDFSPMRTTSKGSLQTPTKPMAAAGARTGLQDSTRRRRDSVDRLWVDVGAAKTTVKRAAPAKHFDGFSFLPNRRVLEAENTHLKYEGQYSASSIKNVVTNHPVAERQKQTRTDFQLGKPGATSLQAEDHSKSGYSDFWKVQSVPQRTVQVAGSASATISSFVPSTSVATISHTVNFSAPSKDTSFSKMSFGRTVTQNVFPQARPVEASSRTSSDVNVGKMDPFNKVLISTTIQDKGITATVPSFPMTSVNESQWKEALNVLQSKATTVQQKGVITKSEDRKVGKLLVEPSSNTPVRLESHQSASLAADRTSQASSIMSFDQGQATTAQAHESPKPEAGIMEEAKIDASLVDSSKVSTDKSTRKSLPAFDNLGEHESLSNMARTLPPNHLISGPVSTVQAESASVSGVTSSASSIAIKPLSQFLGSLSSDIASSSSSVLIKSPITMPGMSMVEEISTSSENFPSATVVVSEASVKPPSFFEKGVMPAEQLTSPSTASMSTSFTPLTVQGPPTVSDEEDMEEEGNNINDFGSSSFAGFGLGSSSPAGSQQSSPFGASSLWNQSSPLSVPAGQLFKPASFSIPTQLTSQPSPTSFGNNVTPGSGDALTNAISGFGTPAQPTAAFGQPAQPGFSGQQALGNALGTFGQTRQIGSPFSVASSPSGFGFASAPTGSGFGSAATSGGFADVTSGGGFAGVAAGGSFAGAATGGGFASFSGGSAGGPPTPNVNTSGFGAFGRSFSAFGGNTNSSMFTQMRK